MKKEGSFSLYWKCQIIGWSVASLYWGYVGFIGTGFSFSLGVLHFVLDVSMYILLTHLFRNFSLYHHWHTFRPNKLLIRLLPAIIVLGLGFMLLTIGKTWLIRYWFELGYSESFPAYFNKWWLTNFMTGIRLMSIWVLAYYGYHFAQRESRAAVIAKDAQLNNLAAQLNPHFFFNSLNNIKALIIENPQAARRAIDLLSDLMRTSLYKRDATLITVQEEMALVNDYLELEKMRFEERLKVHVEVDDRLLAAKLLPFTIQPLVENAVKHGIAKRKEGGTVHIKVEYKGSEMKITVENTGKIEEENPQGLGIKNLKERLALQYNENGKFFLGGFEDETVLAIIYIPLS